MSDAGWMEMVSRCEELELANINLQTRLDKIRHLLILERINSEERSFAYEFCTTILNETEVNKNHGR